MNKNFVFIHTAIQQRQIWSLRLKNPQEATWEKELGDEGGSEPEE